MCMRNSVIAQSLQDLPGYRFPILGRTPTLILNPYINLLISSKIKANGQPYIGPKEVPMYVHCIFKAGGLFFNFQDGGLAEMAKVWKCCTCFIPPCGYSNDSRQEAFFGFRGRAKDLTAALWKFSHQNCILLRASCTSMTRGLVYRLPTDLYTFKSFQMIMHFKSGTI